MYGKTGYKTKQDYDRARYICLKKERDKNKPINPINKLSKVELAYIAGLIDGEGAIYAAHVRSTWYPTVSIHMTSEGVLRWLAGKTGAQKIHSLKSRSDAHRYKSILKTQYLYRISGKNAQLLCKKLLPYFKVKDNHARVVCAFPIDARIAPGHKISSTEINIVRKKLSKQLAALNDNRYKRRHTSK